jgi:hypothetical protein
MTTLWGDMGYCDVIEIAVVSETGFLTKICHRLALLTPQLLVPQLFPVPAGLSLGLVIDFSNSSTSFAPKTDHTAATQFTG